LWPPPVNQKYADVGDMLTFITFEIISFSVTFSGCIKEQPFSQQLMQRTFNWQAEVQDPYLHWIRSLVMPGIRLFLFVCLFAWGLTALSAQIGYIAP